MAELVRIERLARGDGVASTADGPLFVARALAGELVSVERNGERAALRRGGPSPDRVAAYCPEVGRCGGCATQEFAQSPALAWKRDLLMEALSREGVACEGLVGPCVDAHGAGRRRATFHARRGPDGRSVVGFSEARSHSVIALSDCPLLAPSMARALPAARAVAAVLLGKGKPLDLAVTATDTGLDLDVRGLGPLPEPMRLKLVRLAEELDLSRLSIHGEAVVARRKPTLAVGRASLAPPPGGFLQATELGERTLAELALEGVGKAKRVADLFCGSGAFALRLAERAEVYAADTEKPAIAALDAAARGAQGLKRVTAEARDLFRRPLTSSELSRFDAVVFDPPRAGAEAQARQLAASKVRTVVAVSCNAVTLARDAAILIAGGYRLERAVPIDQFRHSAHVETVATFRR
ncbi:class I SAM-dependent RNA methyltransferase [Chenggangzhangella methanolivorans]|uniref:Methyltransferase domain-containing protein n=1 Tax=Chenggangzhangella methanolivorans TaxID=1437009 RepID=A0A9E6RAP7_9HYPH|nr:methyltransferase domain-containing protein [Chenggangzhangella methanolivorans]QZO00895.1 methyltransferase domain-containing protein [Chenggangzhangella methanolivorans]